MLSKIPRVFIDTNVLFSTFYGSINCTKIIQAHVNDKIKAVVSQKVVSELVKNIKNKLPHALPRLNRFLSNTPPEITFDPTIIDRHILKLVDIKDQKIFTSAILTKVDYFITGNISDFKVKKLEKITKIKILTPKEAVELLDL